MAQLIFNVKNQWIRREDSFKPVAKSKNYLYAKFKFLSEEWTGTPTALFGDSQNTYEVLLDQNGECLVPWEVIHGDERNFTVSVFCGDLVTANKLKIRLYESGYTDDVESETPPTPSVYNQIIERMDGVEQTVIDSAAAAAGSASSASSSAGAASGSAAQAAQSASAASTSAQAAASAASSADQKAIAAAGSASEASSKASAAAASASSAAGSAATAGTKASAAAASATAASGSATTASTKAGEAAQSALEAGTSKTDAESAKNAAVQAKTGAEAARDAAQQAIAHGPIITDGYWYLWDQNTNQYVNSGIKAEVEVDDELDDQSENPVQNKVIDAEIGDLKAEINQLQNGKADIIFSNASGAIASFTDGADGLPVQNLVADIDYDANGWTGVTIHQLNKNLFLANASGGSSANVSYVRNEDGSLTFSGQANGTTRTPTLGNVTLPAGTYTVNGITGGSENTYGLRVSKIINNVPEILDTFYSGESTFTITEETIIRLTGRFSAEQTASYSVTMYPMIRPAIITDGTYDTYSDHVYTNDWQTEAGTIYGGTVNPITGKLVSTLAADGSELPEPVEYDITAQTINTLLGGNNIWSDTGDTDVTYRADTKLYLESHMPEIPVEDVQVNGTSVVQDGVANVPIATNLLLGVAKFQGGFGININSAGIAYTAGASESDIKTGTNGYKAIVPSRVDAAIFYGLAKAAADTTQSQSSNPVGTYTDAAKVAIQNMLGLYDPKIYLKVTQQEDAATISSSNFPFDDMSIEVWEELVFVVYQTDTAQGQSIASNNFVDFTIRDVVNGGYILPNSNLYLRGDQASIYRIRRYPSALVGEVMTQNNGKNVFASERTSNYIDKVRWVSLGCANGQIKAGTTVEAYIKRFL